MPVVTGAMVYRDAVVTIDGTAYTNQLRKARLVPTQNIQTYATLVPDGAVQDVDAPIYSWEIEGLQINIAGGLAAYLRGLAVGANISVIQQLKSGVGQPKATFTAVAMVPEFGGEQGAFMVKTLSLPVLGIPVYGTS